MADCRPRSTCPFYYGRNTFGSTDYTRSAAGDAVIGLQYQPSLPLPLPVSARIELRLPMYSQDTQTFEVPAPGDGQIDVTFWLSAGGSFGAVSKDWYSGEGRAPCNRWYY